MIDELKDWYKKIWMFIIIGWIIIMIVTNR